MDTAPVGVEETPKPEAPGSSTDPGVPHARPRQIRPTFKVLGLIGLALALSIAINRLRPIGERQAIDKATDFAAFQDSAFRREAYRSEVKYMDDPRRELRHWDIVFFDRATGRRFENFHFIVYTNNGECILQHRHD